MIKAGITGGIGSGKSLVSKIFETLGIPVFDADSRSKDLLNEDDVLKRQVIKNFGNVYGNNGMLQRKMLAEKVFGDNEQLTLLNSIVHPAAMRAFDTWVSRQKAPYIIKEAAILFEAGTAGGLDIVIGVYAPKALRIQRAMNRSNSSRQEVLSRMERQIDEEIKMRLCDYVIFNDESRLLIPQVLEIHHAIISSKSLNF